MEILMREQFWAKCPAPGTKFLEIADSVCEIQAHSIIPETDEPDDITMIGFSKDAAPVDADAILVISWGSWEGHEDLLAQHKEAVESVVLAGYKHNCILGIPEEKSKSATPKRRVKGN